MIGSEYKLSCGTMVTIAERVVKDLVRVVDAKGVTQVVNITQLIDGTVKWVHEGHNRTAIKTDEGIPVGFYVYRATYDGEVIYIGKGLGHRHLHVTSGKSHVVELNRLYFAGEPVEVDIVKDNMNEGQALAYEEKLIAAYNPRCNTVLKPSPRQTQV